MKPRFALDLTNETIGLLERAAGGWIRIGMTALDVADLDAQMAGLRRLMEARAPEGFCSKLILPNSQILYAELDAPGPDRQSRRAQIATALQGRTPYDVADLVFDWSQGGTKAKVAVIARETLDEAEAFAEMHGLRPVAFVAVPDPARFGGEPFFGLTARMQDHLPEGERLDRDQDPVAVIATDLAVPPPEEVRPEPEAAVAPEASPGSEAEALPESVVEAEADVEPEAQAFPEVDALPEVEALPVPVITVEPVAEPEPAPEAEFAPAAAGARVTTAEMVSPPAPAETVAEAAPKAQPETAQPDTARPDLALPEDEAPFIAIDDEAMGDPAAEDIEDADLADDPDGDGDPRTVSVLRRIEQAVAQARMTEAAGGVIADPGPVGRDGFQSRRPSGPGGAEGSRLASVAPRLGSLIAPPDGRGPRLDGPQRERPAARQTNAPPGGAIGIGAAAERTGRGAFASAMTVAQRARLEAAAWPASRTTLIILAAAAVGFLLLAIALWSLFVGTETVTPPPVPDATATTQDSGASASPPATDQTAAAPAAATGSPAPDTSAAAPAATEPAAAEPTVLPPTDLATTAPAATAAPEPDMAGIPSVAADQPDAAASQPPTEPDAAGELATANGPADQSLPAQPSPWPLGKMPALGADGRILPTPDGVMTPDGFMLYAGKPSVLPPARPAGLAEGAAQAAQAADPLFALKPRARPASLVVPTPAVAPAPADSGAVTPPPTGTDVAALAPPPPADPRLALPRPKARPAGVAKAAETARQNADRVAEAAAAAARAEAEAAQAALDGATAQAVSASAVPTRRPKAVLAAAAKAAAASQEAALPDINSADAVAAALGDATQTVAADPPAPAPAPADTASQAVEEPEPLDGIPTQPTTKTVAKKSTLANALDLGDVNLIGVYGSPAHRRALIRMPSGRFVKVQIGDALDGGQVAAIGDNELTYVKNGRTYVLKMVKGG